MHPDPDAGTQAGQSAETPAADLAHTKRQPNNPLHGVTLEVMLRALVAKYGWPGLAEQIPVRCFAQDPSMGSSLKFLRRTPWAREKVEGLFLYMRRQQAHGREGR
ncbi:MAG: DUF2132 domain-containing protein [Deltaproteobacteria bacterium]|nr:DUF2132 domain-containing protein [Deltaproteobacteria bacterium]